MTDREAEQRVSAAPKVAGTPETKPAEDKPKDTELVTIVAAEGTDVERIAFPGSHEVEGADDDGFVTLPAQVTPIQASVVGSAVEVQD